MRDKERYFNVKITETIKNFISKISGKTRMSPQMLVAVLLLAAGASALLLSEISDGEKAVDTLSSTALTETDTAEYAKELEERLVSIISAIEGAGETRVMVTLESGSENIYLHDFDYGENNNSGGKNSVERKDEYVIVDGTSGEEGIVVRVAEPQVRGVAVVCKGAGSDTVRSQIIETVTALLDISSARVSVAKMN